MQDKFIPDEWYDLLIELTNSRLRASIASFLCKHPNMRFSAGAVPCAEDYQISDILKCLEEPGEEGIIDSYFQNETILYGLTDEEPRHTLMMTLSGLDPCRRKDFLHYGHWISSTQEKDSLGEQVICG